MKKIFLLLLLLFAHAAYSITTPTNLQCATTTTTTVSLTWSEPNDPNLIGYTVRMSTDSSGQANPNERYLWTGGGGWSNQSYTVTGLTTNVTYFFQVKGEGINECADTPFGWWTACKTGVVTSTDVPAFNKIVVVIGENTNASAVFGSPDAPYINSLANEGAKFINSFGMQHPSQPNYLFLISGSNQGVSNDAMTAQFNTPNLARQLVDAAKLFKMYSEDLPSVGWNLEASGLYARKHNSIASFMGGGANQVSDQLNVPFSQWPADFNQLPAVSFIAPNLCNDGHNDGCQPYNNRTKNYDQWIATRLDAYKQWAKNNNSLLIVTYDEDDFTSTNKISTVFVGAHVLTGTYTQSINHVAVLQMIERSYHLGLLGGNQTNINFCWN